MLLCYLYSVCNLRRVSVSVSVLNSILDSGKVLVFSMFSSTVGHKPHRCHAIELDFQLNALLKYHVNKPYNINYLIDYVTIVTKAST